MKQSTYLQQEIRPFIIKHLTAATNQIHLAIGWIADKGLQGLLLKKAIEGVEVKLILVKENDAHLNNTGFQELRSKGVQIIGLNNDYKDYFIDHKFGVIDNNTVLTGNYQWGYRKESEDVAITIYENIPSLAIGFDIEFDYLLKVQQLSENEVKPSNPIVGLLKKIEVLKTLLSIGDTEFIHLRLKEIEPFSVDPNIAQILEQLNQKAFEEALALIKTFTQSHQTLRACIDPPIDSYRREIQMLEDEIATISTEYNETQKLLHKFSKMHTDVLGEVLQQLLYQTKVKAEINAEKEALEEAEKDHEEYTKSYEESKKETIKTLTREEQKELKKLYRQTSLKCHPDRVVEELHGQAEEIFVELNQAYKANDLEKIREINQQLKSGIMLPKSEGITELKKLASTFKSLTQKLEAWQEKLDQLKGESSYKAVSSIENWEIYFKEKKDILLAQLDRLKAANEIKLKEIEGSKI